MQIRLFLSTEWVKMIPYGSSSSETKGTFAAMRHLRNSSHEFCSAVYITADVKRVDRKFSVYFMED